MSAGLRLGLFSVNSYACSRPETAARLWLAAASATALRAGLDLLGVDAPDRL